ncbi:hypothetical protein [Nostoc sp.]|uniref:hypothetical protein n=1 Tax=Nostoc sp. TaxID=1180 RepID=UPI002FF71495
MAANSTRPDDDFLIDLAVECQANHCFICTSFRMDDQRPFGRKKKAKSGSWEKFQQVLNKVPNVEPEEYDKL